MLGYHDYSRGDYTIYITCANSTRSMMNTLGLNAIRGYRGGNGIRRTKRGLTGLSIDISKAKTSTGSPHAAF